MDRYGITCLWGADSLKTVLIVDDNPGILQCYEEILNTSDYMVITCRDGQSALTAIREGVNADLIITDYRMPGMNGLELITQLKRHVPTVPVIMCSIDMRSEVYQKALNLGIVEYMLKPVGLNELRRAVAAAIDGPAKRPDGPGVSG